MPVGRVVHTFCIHLQQIKCDASVFVVMLHQAVSKKKDQNSK